MNCVFVQIRCRPGTAYRVADAITLREIHSELYSTSGEYDLLLKLYVPEGLAASLAGGVEPRVRWWKELK